jgi:hypothetical protein
MLTTTADHSDVRLDAAGNGYQPPPARYTAALLAQAMRHLTGTPQPIADTTFGPRRCDTPLDMGHGAWWTSSGLLYLDCSDRAAPFGGLGLCSARR